MDLANLLSALNVTSPARQPVSVMNTQQPSIPSTQTESFPVLMDAPDTPKKSRSTLRHVLGTLGDAFLMRDGLDPVYRPRVERERLAEAMSGFATDPMTAINEVAALPVPKAAEMAQEMYNAYQTAELRKQQQADTALYRQSIDEDRDAARENTRRYRIEQQLTRFTPLAGALVNDPSIRTKEDYTKAYNRALSAARRIDPDITGTDLGLWDPEDWAPGRGTTVGLTQGQNVSNQTAQERIDATRRGQDMATGRTIISQEGADRRAAVAEAGRDRRAQYRTSSGDIVIPGVQTPNRPAANTPPKFENGKVYKDARGNRARYNNGKWTPVN